MAGAKGPTAMLLGFLPPSAGSYYSIAINSATNFAAFGFNLPAAKTLNEASNFCSSKSGTLGASDLVCQIYDGTGTSGGPGTLLATSSTLASAAAGNAQLRWTGFSQALAANAQYWAVMSNVNAVPGTNNVSLLSPTGDFRDQVGGNFMGWNSLTSSNSGSTWGGFAQSALRLGFSDGTYVGQPFQSTGTPVASGVTEQGTQFVSPANAGLNVFGIAAVAAKVSGSTTGNLVLKLYTGAIPSLVASATIPKANLTAGTWTIVHGYFATVTIAAGSTVTITLADDTPSDANGYDTFEQVWDSDTHSLPLLPFGGTAKYAVYNGSTWSYTTAAFICAGLLLDPTGEFTASGGGSGGFPLSFLHSGGRRL